MRVKLSDIIEAIEMTNQSIIKIDKAGLPLSTK